MLCVAQKLIGTCAFFFLLTMLKLPFSPLFICWLWKRTMILSRPTWTCVPKACLFSPTTVSCFSKGYYLFLCILSWKYFNMSVVLPSCIRAEFSAQGFCLHARMWSVIHLSQAMGQQSVAMQDHCSLCRCFLSLGVLGNRCM